MPIRKAQRRKQKEKEKRGRDKNNSTTNSSSSSSTSSQSHLPSSKATSPSPPNPSSPKFNGNGRDEIIVSEEEITELETEKEEKEMEEEKRVEEREIEPETEQVGSAVQTEEEHKEIPAKSVETGTESAEPILHGEKEEEKGDEDAVGSTVQGDGEENVEVSEVEIIDEKKESIAGPIEVVTTELVEPSCQGLEAAVEREVVELEAGKVVEVTTAENPAEPAESEQTAEVATRDFPISAAKRATWWNCCGLLDVFSGSSR